VPNDTPAPNRATLGFKLLAAAPTTGVALIFDLANFSKFFNQPDIQEYVTKFLNFIFEALEIAFYGGHAYYSSSETLSSLEYEPVHEKFLGDGALYLWTPPPDKSVRFANLLMNRLWHVQRFYRNIIKKAERELPVADLPTSIRFGLARGTIFELERNDGSKEYIGFCINLASRLQKYCPELNFMASARLNVPHDTLIEHGYSKVVATKIRGFPEEVVVVHKGEYERLPDEVRKHLFRDMS
jgi:class 3 adenylate cyclase